MKLYTKAEYAQLTPRSQGYVVYMQGDWPGSELKRLKNPYRKGSMEWIMWNDGQTLGVLEAQDGDG